MRCGFCYYSATTRLETGVTQHVDLPHIRLWNVVYVGVEG